MHGTATPGEFPCTWTAPRRWRPRRSFPAPQVAKQPCALSVPLLGASPARLAAPPRWALWMVHPDGVPGRMHEAVRCIGGLLDIARTDTPSVLRLDTPPHWPCVAATLLVGRGQMPAVRTAAVKLGAALVGERDVGLARGTSVGSIAAVCVAGRLSCAWGGDTRTPERGIEPLLGAEGGVGGVTDAPAAAASASAAVVAAAASAATTTTATSAHTAAAAARLRGRPLVHSAIAAGGGVPPQSRPSLVTDRGDSLAVRGMRRWARRRCSRRGVSATRPECTVPMRRTVSSEVCYHEPPCLLSISYSCLRSGSITLYLLFCARWP